LTPFITLILAYLFLKEELKKLEVYNMIASFIGVLIIVAFSPKQSETKAVNYSGISAIVGVLFNSLSALFVGIVNVIIRALKSIHFAVAAGF
jgi:drug/metabolite transporter (DMT)-like permease